VAKWIVTGGAGFIGANAVQALAERNVEAVVIDDLSRRGARLNLEWLERECGAAFTHVRADIRDADAVDAAWAREGDVAAVLHLAGQVAVTRSVEQPRADFEANAVGTLNVLEATRRHAPEAVFVNASTNKVYGDLGGHTLEETATRYVDVDFPQGVPETEPLEPNSPYAASKAAGDLYTLVYADACGLRAVSLRQSCIYGPRQFGVEDQGWVAWLVLAARLGLPLTIFGTGKQTRDLLFVDDLVDLYQRVVARPEPVAGRAYNVGGGPSNTLSLVELLDRLDGVRVTKAAPRLGDQKVFVADSGSLEAALGWRPTTALEEGLERLLAWIDANAEAVAGVMRAT
jgi:CDP-paratose 2-epimerase